MRTKRSARSPATAPPISAAVAGRARREPADEDREGDARAQLLRVVALLGIGLVAAAILLPSGSPAVVVPGDALQPATAAAAGDAKEDAGAGGADTEVGQSEVGRGAPGARGPSSFATGSSAASVVGDDLARATPAETTPAETPPPTTTQKRGKTATRRATSSANTHAPRKRAAAKRRRASHRSSSRSSPAPASAPTTQAPPVAAPPSPAPARGPAPRRSRGGPKAEFGGL